MEKHVVDRTIYATSWLKNIIQSTGKERLRDKTNVSGMRSADRIVSVTQHWIKKKSYNELKPN
jgi:hypothetical protein